MKWRSKYRKWMLAQSLSSYNDATDFYNDVIIKFCKLLDSQEMEIEYLNSHLVKLPDPEVLYSKVRYRVTEEDIEVMYKIIKGNNNGKVK